MKIETNRRKFLLLLAATVAVPALSVAQKKQKKETQKKTPISGRFFFNEEGNSPVRPSLGRLRCSAVHYFSEGTILDR
jgi:hypothetical protein